MFVTYYAMHNNKINMCVWDKSVFGLMLIIAISCNQAPDCKKQIMEFGGEEWVFPSTMREVTEKHDLEFNSPAYYHKMLSDSIQVIVHFESEGGDFDNDLQQKEDLYSRDANVYIFQVKKSKDTYDSLKHSIESFYGKRFYMVEDTLMDHSSYPAKKRAFKHNLLKVDSCLTVGIKNSHSNELGQIVTVHYMYGFTMSNIGIEAGNY